MQSDAILFQTAEQPFFVGEGRVVFDSCQFDYQKHSKPIGFPTNDNFQDGALRDQVDGTAIPKAWLAAT